jgi:hypothetical protein
VPGTAAAPGPRSVQSVTVAQQQLDLCMVHLVAKPPSLGSQGLPFRECGQIPNVDRPALLHEAGLSPFFCLGLVTPTVIHPLHQRAKRGPHDSGSRRDHQLPPPGHLGHRIPEGGIRSRMTSPSGHRHDSSPAELRGPFPVVRGQCAARLAGARPDTTSATRPPASACSSNTGTTLFLPWGASKGRQV